METPIQILYKMAAHKESGNLCETFDFVFYCTVFEIVLSYFYFVQLISYTSSLCFICVINV